MPFCPTCRTEYGNQTQSCEICNSSLVDSLPGDDAEDDNTSTELVELAEFSNVSEAEMIREILEENDIRTVQRGEADPIGVASGAQPTTLLVEERQLSRAREVYEAYFAGDQTQEPPVEE